METEYLNQWLVQIYATDNAGYPCIGTGYAIGHGLILTSRHVVLFPERAENPELKLVFAEKDAQGQLVVKDKNPVYDRDNAIRFTDEDIVFKGDDETDLVVICCPQKLDFDVPELKLATANPPLSDTAWHTRGFPRAGRVADGRRDSLGFSGTLQGMKTEQLFELYSSAGLDGNEPDNGWGGLSGSPVMVDGQLVAVITDQHKKVEKYFHAVAIPALARKNEAFRQAVRLDANAVAESMVAELHAKIISEISPVLSNNRSFSKCLNHELGIASNAAADDTAKQLLKRSTGEAISKLTAVTLNQKTQLAATPDRWESHLYDLEQICGWLLINSVEPQWWLDNLPQLEKTAQEEVLNTLELEDKAYSEVIISRSVLQAAQYTLNRDSDPVPASESHNPMLFDGINTDATEPQLLSKIFKELRGMGMEENDPDPDQNPDFLLKGIAKTARALCDARGRKLIYYIVSESQFNLLKTMPHFQEKLAGHLQFICCNTQPSSSASSEDQELLLEKLAVILRLRRSGSA